jgi:hypothetical protein
MHYNIQRVVIRVSNSSPVLLPRFGESEESIFLYLGVLGIKIHFLRVPQGFEETIFS